MPPRANHDFGQGVLPFVSDRLSVPAVGADFRLLDWLPDDWKEILEKPDERLVDARPKGPCPPMYLTASPKEWKKYLSRLGGAGMAVGMPVSEVPAGPGGENLAALGQSQIPRRA